MPDDMLPARRRRWRRRARRRRLPARSRVPGDKSISHRALMFGALAVGRTEITGLLEGEDVLATAAALRAMGAGVERAGGRALAGRRGRGRRPRRAGRRARPRQFRHRGAAAARHPRDPSVHRLRHRRRLAAQPADAPGHRAAVAHRRAVSRAATAAACRSRSPARRARCRTNYRLPVPSAQVKSAVLLAGLNTPGETTRDRAAADPRPYRAHARPFRRDGARSSRADGGGKRITVDGQPELDGGADRRAGRPVLGGVSAGRGADRAGLRGHDRPASGSTRRAPGCSTSLARDGRRHRLRERARSRAASRSPICGCAPARCSGAEVPPERAPSMIDEYPILAVAAACAQRPHGHARPRRTARQGKRPARRHRRGARAPAASRSTVEGDDLIVEGTGEPAAGGATDRDPARPPHRDGLPGARPRRHASRSRSTTPGRSPPASPISCR